MGGVTKIFAILAVAFTVTSGNVRYDKHLQNYRENGGILTRYHNTTRGSLNQQTLEPHPIGTYFSTKRSSPRVLLVFSHEMHHVRRRRNLVSSRIMLTQHFNSKLMSPGEDLCIQCAATSERPPRFIWERDGVVISSSTDPRYSIGQLMTSSGVGVVSHLNISRVRVEDGGLFSCAAIEGDATASHAARIDVYGPPYIRTLPPIKVQSGEPLKLRCPYYGYPISKLEWEHKGKNVQSTLIPQNGRYRRRAFGGVRKRRMRRQIYDPNETGVLSIAKVQKEENGDSYTCVVYSPSGEMARRSFEVQVVEPPILDKLRVGTDLKEGQIVQITCNIIGGDPPIYFSWLKDSKKILPSLKITERSSDLFSVLIIKKVSLEHCGQYFCIATNHIGKANQTAELYINVAPKWIEEPTNTSLLLGQRGTVYCNANGYPVPQVHWMKRDASLGIWRPVLDLAGGGVMSHPNGTLVIEVVTLSDEGMYACNVENGVGEPLNKNIWISVNKPVHFESAATNLTTKLGLPVLLTCQPLGDYPIRIKWFLNGHPLDFSSTRLTVSDNQVHNGLKSTVSINYVESKDGGFYECRASNPFGVATHIINLSILEPPTPPLDLQIESIASRSAKVSWRDTIRAHVQYYSLQYSTNDYMVWDAAKTVNVTRKDTDRQSIHLQDLLPAVDYRVRVASGNLVDLSVYTQPAHFTTLPEAPSAPPIGVQVQPTDNPGELSVVWLPPPKESHHGGVVGYHVKAEPRGRGEIDESQIKTIKVLSKNGKQDVILTGLLKNTRYAVSVCAFNSAGNGPFSLAVYQATREGAPDSPPMSVECRGASSSSLRVSWQPITSSEASLIGYTVYYSSEDGPWQNISTPHTEVYLQSLQKFTNFTVKIAGFSSFGLGPFSHHIVCATLQDVPGPPSAIKVLVASSTSLLVSWKSPDSPNGEITHYTVYVKPTSGNSPPLPYRVDPSESSKPLHLEVRNLSEGRQYEVSVTASTRAGEGPNTHVVSRQLTSKVVAGVWSLGGDIRAGAGGSVLLWCGSVGAPPPRAVWYHQHYIITHHPRYTRNHDDSLLINNIDQSLSGNYTCLAKNLYGSDSVSYTVTVLPTPEPPRINIVAHRHALQLQWDEAKGSRISYNLTWKEAAASWQDPDIKSIILQGITEYLIDGLRCGTKYSIRITASNSVGTSTPAYVEAKTLGGVPIGPTTTEWFISNATHITIQLSGWEHGGCDVITWDVRYKPTGGEWAVAVNEMPHTESLWNHYGPVISQPSVFVIGNLEPATWYQIRIAAQNAAGTTVGFYRYATTTILGEIIEPPPDYSDLYLSLIAGCFAVAVICLVIVVFLLRNIKGSDRSETVGNYNSVTTECNSKASDRSTEVLNTPATVNDNRLYSTPIHIGDNKQHEMYEISPYAQFAIGFRTFGHVENQEIPRMPGIKSRYEAETSFQVRSESEESDCMSRTTTLKSAPRKSCRVPYHNR